MEEPKTSFDLYHSCTHAKEFLHNLTIWARVLNNVRHPYPTPNSRPPSAKAKPRLLVQSCGELRWQNCTLGEFPLLPESIKTTGPFARNHKSTNDKTQHSSGVHIRRGTQTRGAWTTKFRTLTPNIPKIITVGFLLQWKSCISSHAPTRRRQITVRFKGHNRGLSKVTLMATTIWKPQFDFKVLYFPWGNSHPSARASSFGRRTITLGRTPLDKRSPEVFRDVKSSQNVVQAQTAQQWRDVEMTDQFHSPGA